MFQYKIQILFFKRKKQIFQRANKYLVLKHHRKMTIYNISSFCFFHPLVIFLSQFGWKRHNAEIYINSLKHENKELLDFLHILLYKIQKFLIFIPLQKQIRQTRPRWEENFQQRNEAFINSAHAPRRFSQGVVTLDRDFKQSAVLLLIVVRI